MCFLFNCSRRVERLRAPPCTYFNCGKCEYTSVHAHTTRGQTHSHRPVAMQRAHICAVCFGQGLTSPHRAKACPIIFELDNVLFAEWQLGQHDDEWPVAVAL